MMCSHTNGNVMKKEGCVLHDNSFIQRNETTSGIVISSSGSPVAYEAGPNVRSLICKFDEKSILNDSRSTQGNR